MKASLLAWLCCLTLHAAKPLDVQVTTPHVVLMNAETGAILYEKDARALVYPGSTTKIATALYILQTASNRLEERVVGSLESLKVVTEGYKTERNFTTPAYWLEPDGVMMQIRQQEVFSLGSLLQAALIYSANDAANILAEYLGGDIPTFMDKLNEMLRHLGCTSTHFTNPHGLFHPEHVTTAYDMALLAKIALQDPLFRAIVQSPTFERPKTNLQEPSLLKQGNQLVVPTSKYYYPKAIGIKTGYTRKAKYNLVAAATDGERTLIAALHTSPSSRERFEDAIHLFEAAFAEKKVNRLLFRASESKFQRPIPKAKAPLLGALTQDVILSYYPSEEPTAKAEIVWSPPEVLPIARGALVGKIVVTAEDGRCLMEAPLFASAPVTKQWYYVFKEDVLPYLWLPLVGLVGIYIWYRVRKAKGPPTAG